ncbi:biotin/acetyl-CoA-carboxylase ligase [Ignisphaera aggregans DSM 17230]|uniref:Biotin/acetyl-CoA-carboxylase ligase n=1 Tax=Ignisphaera aggregans (strain DSM 17230 / JCM 13409 / AQ1.S1) TaxID=583356 RepID=E0SNI2_IGNAA|nr:biotin/acetyl-CoA-carboxylase ligase [Ignisphaera aggregans DSM 17230]
MDIENYIVRALLERLRVGDIVNGNRIAQELGVSRALIHKAIDFLRSFGLPIKSVPGRGYILPMSDNLSDAIQLLEMVGVGANIVIFPRCDRSSQDIAKEMAYSGASEWSIVVCEEMFRGRGRLGRMWYAPRGGLWFSILLRPRYIDRLHFLSIVGSLAVAEAINILLGVGAGVKWPNDVIIGGKKVCGILVEGEVEADRIRHIVIGIGINVNNDIPSDIRDIAIALKDVVGRYIPRATLLTVIVARLYRYYGYMLTGRYRDIVSRYREMLLTRGREVKVVLVSGEEIIGRAIDVDEIGRLQIDTGRDIVSIDAGDVYHLR